MKKRLLPLLLAAMLLLTVTVFADMGPKPQLIVNVENAPEELYYLDLLAPGGYEGEYEDPWEAWRYGNDEQMLIDEDLLALLRDNVPEDWHACLAQGTTGAPIWGRLCVRPDARGFAQHSFGYHGVPDTYRIMIATESGKVWISGTMEREVLQSSVRVNYQEDVEGIRVETPPVWVGYVLQFLATFVPTVLIEGALLLLFGFSWKKNRRAFLLTNLVTQGFLALYAAMTVLQHGVSAWSYFFLIPIELVIMLAETLIYRSRLTGQSRARAAWYGVCANAASALLGILLAGPVWRFVVSIS